MALTTNSLSNPARNYDGLLVLPLAAMSACFLFYDAWAKSLEESLSPLVTRAALALLHLFSGGFLLSADSNTRILGPNWSAVCVNYAALGLFGVLSFLCLLSFCLARNPRRWTWKGWLAIALGGVSGMLALNLIRIALSAWLGAHLHELYTDPEIAQAYSEQVAAQLGWPIYGIVFALLLVAFRRGTQTVS